MSEKKELLKRLDDNEKDFFFKYLEENSIELNDILRTESIKELLNQLKIEWNEIEGLKIQKNKRSRNFVTGKLSMKKVRVFPSDISMEVKNRQKRISKFIGLIETKVLPEVKIYEKFNVLGNNIDYNGEFKNDVEIVENKIRDKFKEKPTAIQIAEIIQSQYLTIEDENRNTYKNKMLKKTRKLNEKSFFELVVDQVYLLGKGKFTADKLYNSIHK